MNLGPRQITLRASGAPDDEPIRVAPSASTIVPTHVIARAVMVAYVIVGMLVAACARDESPPGPRYGRAPEIDTTLVVHFAVHPLHNPAKLIGVYGPLADYLSAQLAPVRFELQASRDYAAFESKIAARDPEMLLPNPWQTLRAIEAGYVVIATAGEARDFRGLILVRRDSGIRAPRDLKGRAVSYPSPTALAACIMPQYLLHDAGLDVVHDLDNRYVGSQESSIMNVVLGRTAAGATWPPPWREFQREHPAEAAELRVAWETPPLVNNSVMMRGDLPVELRERVRSVLLGLPATPDGRALLEHMETARFLRADDSDYDVARAYVARFERDVRKVETP